MNRTTNLAERVRFGTFELNVRTGELVSIGTAAVEAESAKVLLREQPFQILRILVERQGKIVTRQEIRRILWPNDTIVDFDRSINVAMAILRKALGDDAEQPKYVETLPRRGYRLIAPVEWQQSSTEGTPRKSYEEFLTLWRNADPDLPAYKQAKAESAALAKTHSN